MKLVDLDSCIVENDKILCDFKKPKLGQDSSDTIIAGRANISNEEFKVEAAPYVNFGVGLSIPLGPLPGSPSLELDTGPSFPWTIFPIPTRIVDRIGQSWVPPLFKGGPEDDFQGIPPLKYNKPEEVLDQIFE